MVCKRLASLSTTGKRPVSEVVYGEGILLESESRRHRGSPQGKVLVPAFDVAGNATTSRQSSRRSQPIGNGKRRIGHLEHEPRLLAQLGDRLRPARDRVTEEPY